MVKLQKYSVAALSQSCEQVYPGDQDDEGKARRGRPIWNLRQGVASDKQANHVGRVVVAWESGCEEGYGQCI